MCELLVVISLIIFDVSHFEIEFLTTGNFSLFIIGLPYTILFVSCIWLASYSVAGQSEQHLAEPGQRMSIEMTTPQNFHRAHIARIATITVIVINT